MMKYADKLQKPRQEQSKPGVTTSVLMSRAEQTRAYYARIDAKSSTNHALLRTYWHLEQGKPQLTTLVLAPGAEHTRRNYARIDAKSKANQAQLHAH